MSIDKKTFIDIVGKNMASDLINSKFENEKFIQFVDDFSSKFSKKQWSWLGLQWTLGLNIIFTLLFGKRRFGNEIFDRKQIDAGYFFSKYKEFAQFDIEKEVPLLVSGSFLLTNKYFYFNAFKSKKLKEAFSQQTGKIDLKRIKRISTKRGVLTSNTIEISMNDEVVCAIPFISPSDAKVMEKFLTEINNSLNNIL
jgi:hypothetical protein